MRVYPIVLFVILGMSGCSKSDEPDALEKSIPNQQVGVMRNQNAAQLGRGHRLYATNCAACHGANAQGAANWSNPGADGKYPPPPLNGTGHAWHHPKRSLVSTIQHGTIRLGGSMPAWKRKLNEEEINDIIAWFQALWPDELYAAWQRRNRADLLETR